MWRPSSSATTGAAGSSWTAGSPSSSSSNSPSALRSLTGSGINGRSRSSGGRSSAQPISMGIPASALPLSSSIPAIRYNAGFMLSPSGADRQTVDQGLPIGAPGRHAAHQHCRQQYAAQQRPFPGPGRGDRDEQPVVREYQWLGQPQCQIHQADPEQGTGQRQAEGLEQQQAEDVPWTCADRAQYGHLPAPFVEAGENGGEHAHQTGQDDEHGDDEQ